MSNPRTPDLVVENHGTVYTFEPVSEVGKTWLEESCDHEPWQWQGTRLCVDHRLAYDLVVHAKEDGLEVFA